MWQFSISSFLSLLSPYLALSLSNEAKMVCISFNSNRLNLEGYNYLQYMLSPLSLLRYYDYHFKRDWSCFNHDIKIKKKELSEFEIYYTVQFRPNLTLE